MQGSRDPAGFLSCRIAIGLRTPSDPLRSYPDMRASLPNFCRRCRTAVLPVLLVLRLSAQETTPTPTPTYPLFTGVEIVVRQGETPVPVLGIDQRTFVLGDATHSRVNPRDAGGFSAAHRVRVARAQVQIDELRPVRTYSPDNDPVMRGMLNQIDLTAHAQRQMMQQQEDRLWNDMALQGEYRIGMEARRQAAENGGFIAPGTPDPEVVREKILAADAAFNAVHEAHAAAAASAGLSMMELEGRAQGEESFDLLDLSFVLSSYQPIHDAYVVVLAAIKEGEAEEKVRTFYEAVGVLDDKPRRVRIRRAGFEPGFTVGEVKVHVYARGQELASNLSARRMELTEGAVREYLLLSHLGEHRGETLPAAPVWSLAPRALFAAESPAGFDQPIAVTIDADGRLLSIHDTVTEAKAFLGSIVNETEVRTRPVDAAAAKSFSESVRVGGGEVAVNQSRRVPAELAAIVQEMFFVPALEEGEPVASATEINLAGFFP